MADEKYATGGIISEPIAGVSLVSRRGYGLGEAEHQCQCEECDPSVTTPFCGPSKRQGPNHFAVSLGDVHGPDSRYQFSVTVNGQPVSESFEVFAGEQGTVHAYSDPLHVCKRCGGGPCMMTYRGKVQVTIAPR